MHAPRSLIKVFECQNITSEIYKTQEFKIVANMLVLSIWWHGNFYMSLEINAKSLLLFPGFPSFYHWRCHFQ